MRGLAERPGYGVGQQGIVFDKQYAHFGISVVLVESATLSTSFAKIKWSSTDPSELPMFEVFSNDLVSFTFSAALLLSYHLFLRYKLLTDPAYTIQAVNAAARLAWVEGIMTKAGNEVLAVQTLRNAIMGPTFLATTAVLLLIGTITLTGQADKLEQTWHALNIFGASGPELWLAKVLLLLMDFLIAFMCFTQAVRLFIHVGFMINVPPSDARRNSAQFVATQLNRAGVYHWIGMRAYYCAVPLVFWLFGPHFMMLATLVTVAILFYLDRTPDEGTGG
jgi:uncharacterized membrane protein